MSDDSDPRRQKSDALEQKVANLTHGGVRRGTRKRSTKYIWGLPLYEIALGPDPDRNEVRGCARGIIAIVDVATGVFAMGGVARGLIALGGVALGAISLGGCSLGVLVGIGGLGFGALAIGGLAVGLVALGGAAIGVIAVGGGAFGYYVCGGGAFGKYVISGMEQHPEAIRFFGEWIPEIDQLAPPPDG